VRVVIAKKTVSTVGGSETFARALHRELRALGHDVRLIGMRAPWDRPGIAQDTASTFLNVRLGRVGAAIDALFPTTLVRDEDLREAIRGADVVHSLAREWAGALERVARAERAAFVETPLVHPGQPFSGDAASDVARYRRDDAVIALTNWEATWYRERGITRVHVTGIGPNLVGLPEVARDPGTILFVGRKEVYKGYKALRNAARLVWRERPEARFVAIGQRPWYGALWKFERHDPRWIDHDLVSEREKAEAYARATIFAMPSDHETFGHTYLEAWLAGLPVIAGDIPPLREVVREGVDGLHARNEPRAVADAILALLRDPERARWMGVQGRTRVLREFTWPVVAQRTELAYRAAIEARDATANR
jgi:glycosyltransferase involved in cell wall biosynthesis